jgi:hypothetical protein
MQGRGDDDKHLLLTNWFSGKLDSSSIYNFSGNYQNSLRDNRKETHKIVPPKHYSAKHMYEGHLQSLWTHLITPSQNFVEMQ